MRLESAPKTLLAAAAALAFVLALVPAPAGATSPPVQSTISIFLACPSGVLFGAPSGSSTCGSGNYTATATYTGMNETMGSTQNSVFFLASATGGVKVMFNVTDVTTGDALIQGVGYGKMDGGSCASPTVVTPASFVPSSNQLRSGDKVKVNLTTLFTGTGTPVLCSGGAAATVISFGTTISAGGGIAYLSTTLSAGNPIETTINGYKGVSEAYVNTAGVVITAIVVGVVKSSSGATVTIISSSVTAVPNISVVAFLPFGTLPSGTYSITLIAITSSDVPISSPITTTVAV